MIEQAMVAVAVKPGDEGKRCVINVILQMLTVPGDDVDGDAIGVAHLERQLIKSRGIACPSPVKPAQVCVSVASRLRRGFKLDDIDCNQAQRGGMAGGLAGALADTCQPWTRGLAGLFC